MRIALEIHYLAPLRKVNGVDNPVSALVNGIRLSSLSSTGDTKGRENPVRSPGAHDPYLKSAFFFFGGALSALRYSGPLQACRVT